MKTLIKNCHIISDNLEIANGYIQLEDKLIVAVGAGIADETGYEQIIDAENSYAMPGFIDIHTHGALGFHAGDGNLASLEKIAQDKLNEGVTTFCPSTVTMPEELLLQAMMAIKSYHANERFAKVAGVHLEGPFLNPNKLGGQNAKFVQAPNIEFVKKLNNIYKISIVSFAPEVDGGLEFTAQLNELGIITACAHSNANYNDIQQAKQHGLSHLTHFCNQMTALHHRDVGAVGAGLLDDQLSAELICDKIHICPEMLKLIFKCKSLSTLMLITDSNYLRGLPDGEYELRGLRNVLRDGKIWVGDTNTLGGSGLKYNIGLKNVAEITELPLKDLIKTTSLNQAHKLGLKKLGKLEAGFIADIILLDREFNVNRVFINGLQRRGASQ
jgi:N-acetylglucosamine-6-phosphate deacetylase